MYFAKLAMGLAMLGLLCLRVRGLSAEQDASSIGLTNPFFAMDTGTKDARHRTPESQARMLKELGYDGYGGGVGDIPGMLKVLDAHGLKMFNIYTGLTIDDGQYDPKLKAAIKALKGRQTFIWLFVRSKKHKPSSPDGDESGVKSIREIADLAAASGLKVALYPHTGCWIERVEDAVRVAKKVDRKNVGVTFNLCHWLRVDKEKNLRPLLKLAAPHLFLVTINGADSGGKDWKTLIQTLDRGTYDVGKVLTALKKLGYTGPIGLQGYGIGGDVYDNLKRSMAAWRRLSRQGDGDWPIFHGNSALTGLARGKLSDKPALLWRFKTGGAVVSSPAIAGGKVYVGSDDGHVYAISLSGGKKLWAYEVPHKDQSPPAVQAPPLAVDGKLIVGDDDGTLHCLDATSGKQLWTYKTGDRITGSANWFRADGKLRILVAGYDQHLHCVDAATGGKVWAYEGNERINGAPAVAAGKAAFGECSGTLHVVNLADGKAGARIDIGSYVASSVAVAGGRAYAAHAEGQVVCVDLTGSKILWRYGEGDLGFFSSPAVDEKNVVVGGQDKKVHCIGRGTGRKRWTFRTRGRVDSSPVICDGKVVAGSDDGRVYILRLSDGKKLWSYEVGRAILSSPAVAFGRVVVGCEDGFVYAFGPVEPKKASK